MLRYAINHSTQLVMFLTGSETLGVEKLLDDFAGKAYTLSNAAHYPTKLINRPSTDRLETLVCSCNHRQVCSLCQRHVTALSTRMMEV